MLQVESVCQYDGSFEGGVLKEGHSVTDRYKSAVHVVHIFVAPWMRICNDLVFALSI